MTRRGTVPLAPRSVTAAPSHLKSRQRHVYNFITLLHSSTSRPSGRTMPRTNILKRKLQETPRLSLSRSSLLTQALVQCQAMARLGRLPGGCLKDGAPPASPWHEGGTHFLGQNPDRIPPFPPEESGLLSMGPRRKLVGECIRFSGHPHQASQLGDLKQQKFTPSQFWGPDV